MPVVREGQDRVVLEHPVDAAAGSKILADVPVRLRHPAALGLEPVVVGDGVALEEVDEVEGRRLLLTSIAPTLAAYSSLIPTDRRRPPLALRPLQPVSRL